MALFEFHIHNHVDLEEVTKKLNSIIKHQHDIMGNIQDLNNKIAELKAAWDTENQEISDKLTGLQTEVQSLKDIIAAQGTPEQIDEAIAKIDEIIVDVKDTVQPEPTPEG